MIFEDDQSTRHRVARSILVEGPSTAAALGERLDLTPAAVRRHLDQLVEDGAVEAREPRRQAHRGRGRPAKVFALTERGREGFDQQYDDLAVQALRFLHETGGEEAVRAFAQQRVAFIEDRFGEVATARPELSPVEVLASVLTDEGYAAAVQGAAAWRASSCASSTARSPTSPTSSRSCARPRPRPSAGCSAATSSGWPPSPTATASAPPASQTSHHTEKEKVTT